MSRAPAAAQAQTQLDLETSGQLSAVGLHCTGQPVVDEHELQEIEHGEALVAQHFLEAFQHRQHRVLVQPNAVQKVLRSKEDDVVTPAGNLRRCRSLPTAMASYPR